MSRLLALLVAPPAQRLLDAFTRLTGARIGIFDQAGKEVSAGQDHPGCAYCAMLRGRLGREPACLAEDRRHRLAAAERGSMVAYRCHAGLDEAIMPLAEDGRLVGWIMVGQFRTAVQPPTRVLRAAWAQADAAALAKAFAAVPLVARRADLLELFAALVASIAAQRLVQPRRDAAIDRLLAAGAGRTVTLAQAARLAGVGRSRMAERARAALGCGLRQAQISARLERAAEAMRSGSARTVAEAARRAGFSDPAYFSRLWSRRRGSPPSRLLQGVRTSPG